MKKKSKMPLFLFSIGWVVSIIAGLKGFQFWYGGFVVFFWLFLGTLNYSHRTTLWLAKKRPLKFLKFYFPLLIFWVIIDLFGQFLHLWEYPVYDTLPEFLWVYVILYSFAGFALLELVYFISGIFGEKIRFVKRKESLPKNVIDKLDSALLIIMLLVSILTPLAVFKGIGITKPLFLLLVFPFILWTAVDTIRLKFHVAHWGHYFLIFVVTTFVAVVLNEIPNTGAFEWIYLTTPLTNFTIFGIYWWVILGWCWWALLLFRLWTLFVLHPEE